MRKLKKIISFIVVLGLMLSFSTGAFAASYTAANYDDLQTAFADDSGEDVDIDLTANVTGSSDEALTAKDGIKYTISSQNDSVLNGASFDGEGEVEINTDLTDTLHTEGDVTVTVNGDITATGEDSDGVHAGDNSTVTVNGDIEASGDGVHTEDESSVTIVGDIDADGNGVYTIGDSTVNITGNIDAEEDGVHIGESNNYDMKQSSVTVNGDITAGGDGVDAQYSNSVTVNGDITAGGIGVYSRRG